MAPHTPQRSSRPGEAGALLERSWVALFATLVVLATAPAASGRQRRARALILVPTRELAVQIGEVARQLARHEAVALKVTVCDKGGYPIKVDEFEF
mgnify:CR=1 FL=1